jgi:serine/threonine protein kinase
VAFLDPGLLRGDEASPASDVWSIGATLHWALTGEGIHGELPLDDPLLAVRRVLSSQPVIDPGLADEVRSVIEAALEPDPGARPSAGEIADRLHPLVR